jgi:hypothetical protein
VNQTLKLIRIPATFPTGTTYSRRQSETLSRTSWLRCLPVPIN